MTKRSSRVSSQRQLTRPRKNELGGEPDKALPHDGEQKARR